MHRRFLVRLLLWSVGLGLALSACSSSPTVTRPTPTTPLSPWNWLYYAVHASAYTAVLFLAGIFGERPKSGKEVILPTQRALEQQALECWRMQKEAQIEAMMRRGLPLGAVAAALASPETAERIAIPEAATTGNRLALDAARLDVQRAGQDLTLLDGLRTTRKALSARSGRSAITDAELEEEEREEVAINGSSPLSLARRR
jgi:hypothetical protein